MAVSEKHIAVTRTARYCTWGVLSEKTQKVWIACHGYGMLASFFIKKFEALDPLTNYVIAPEALSRGYLDGMSGRVGASWMTKEDREAEIEDYIGYLDAIYAEELEGKIPEACKLTGLGFSQGCATISRWACATNYKIDNLILWGGSPGMELISRDSKLHDFDVQFVIGDEDEYFTEEVRKQIKDGLEGAGFNWPIHTYKGGHAIYTDLLLSLSEK